MMFIRISPSYISSACLLIAMATFGYFLLPGHSNYDREVRLRVDGISNADPNIFLFEDGEYLRVGRVFAEDGGFRLRLFDLDNMCDCVVVLARPNVLHLISMQTDEERRMFAGAAASIIADIVQQLLTAGTADSPRSPINSILFQTFTSAIETPPVRASWEELVTYLTEQAGPEGMYELRQILLERVRQAFGTVFDDMLQNYGLDLLTQDFELSPLRDSVSGFLSDRRVINVFLRSFSNLIDESDVATDVEIFTVAFVDALIASLLDEENEILFHQEIWSDDVLSDFFGAVENLISENGSTHPIFVAMMRNSLSQTVPESEAVFVVLPRNVGMNWFDPGVIYDLSGDPLG